MVEIGANWKPTSPPGFRNVKRHNCTYCEEYGNWHCSKHSWTEADYDHICDDYVERT